MTTPGAGRRLAQAALRDQRGTAFLMGLMIVMVMTLLGVALFEMSTIEAGLARSDALDIQAFYCAEAEAARVYALYAPANDPDAELASRDPRPTLRSRSPMASYVSSVSAEVIDATAVVTVTATCRLPTGRTRTVQRNGTRAYPNPILKFAEAGAGADPAPERLRRHGAGRHRLDHRRHLRRRQCPSPRRGDGHGLWHAGPAGHHRRPRQGRDQHELAVRRRRRGGVGTGSGHSPAGAEQCRGQRHHRPDPVGGDERRRNPDDDGALPGRDRLQPRGDLCPARRHQRGQ